MGMFAITLLCVLVGCISATHWPYVGPGFRPKLGQDEHEPRKCCPEPYFTYEASHVIVSAPDGVLGTELINTRGAYDSIDKKIGLDTVEKFPNGTEDILKYIADYKTGESFFVYTDEGQKKCVKLPLTEGFPNECIPDDSTYAGFATLGNRALEVNNWYFVDKTDPSEEYHTYEVTKSECIDVGYISTLVDTDTGHLIDTDAYTVHNYNLGICDRDYWFKPPPECEPERIQTVEKIPERFRRVRGLRGKRLFK